MHRTAFSIASCWLILLAILGPSVRAQDVTIKEIPSLPPRQEYFSLAFNRQHLFLRMPAVTGTPEVVISRENLHVTPKAVNVASKPVFDAAGVHIADSVLPYDRITDLFISDSAGTTIMLFSTSPTAAHKTIAMRRGNRITFSDSIRIAKGEFVRGVVFSVLGKISVDGEVNKDVISLFGNIAVSPTAVIRGDVVSIQGEIAVARRASVYGQSYSGTQEKLARLHRLWRSENRFSWFPFFYYNRVDGATPNVEFRLRDPDSLLPTVSASIGYAFEPSRWRLKAGLDQNVVRPIGLSVGASVYRDLVSDDDWLLSDKENTLFALVVSEDFKDYYEAIGGEAHVRAMPVPKLTLTAGYRNEVTNWWRARRNLWALFGGEKRFPENFATVPEALRERGIQEIDTGQIASIYGIINFDNRLSAPFAGSAWALTLNGELSHPNLGSDFDFQRFTLSVRRYQLFTPSTILLARGMVGGSNGYLPMHRKFFLGGLGTLYGYRHKEFLGNRFWMTNFELRQNILRTDFALSVLWDVGQIGTYKDDLGEVRHSVGGALYLGDDVRISVARRLDSRQGQKTRIYVRLEHVF